MSSSPLRLTFWHHEPHGPVSLEDIWSGRHRYGGSISRLRILFWLAAAGHEVRLYGNVLPGRHRAVVAAAQEPPISSRPGDNEIVIFNNPPPDSVWFQWRDSERRPPALIWAGNPFDPRWLRRVDERCLLGFVCVSQWHRDLYRLYPAFESVEVCYSGCDTDIMEAVVAERFDRPTVVFASIPRATKGLHHMIRAWPLVRMRIRDARLVVCGSASMHDPGAQLGGTGVLDASLEAMLPEVLETLIREDAIQFLGVQDLASAYRAMKGADVVAVNCNFNGSAETFCRSAVEAQFAGKPVLGAARGALNEVVQGGVSGLLVERPEELAPGVVSLLGEPESARRMGAHGRARSNRFSDYDAIAAEWETIVRRRLSRVPAEAPLACVRDVGRKLGLGRLAGRLRDMKYGPFRTGV